MKEPAKELERLSKNPVKTELGSIFVTDQTSNKPFIEVDLKSYPGCIQGGISTYSPDEWIRFVEVMRAYFAQEEKS